MRHVVVVEDFFRLRLVDFQAGQAFVHVQDEIVGVIFAAGPFVDAERALFRDSFGGCPIKNGLALLGRQFTRMVTRQVIFYFGVKPP